MVANIFIGPAKSCCVGPPANAIRLAGIDCFYSNGASVIVIFIVTGVVITVVISINIITIITSTWFRAAFSTDLLLRQQLCTEL